MAVAAMCFSSRISTQTHISRSFNNEKQYGGFQNFEHKSEFMERLVCQCLFASSAPSEL